MITEYFSLRYIYVSDTVDNKVCYGCFIYCYRMQLGFDVSAYTDYIDSNVLNSVKGHYPNAMLNKMDIFYDCEWQKWLIQLQKICVPFYFLPSCNNINVSFQLAQKYENVTYPRFRISFYPQILPYKEYPSYPFNKIAFRYNINLSDEYSGFVRDLSEFISSSVFAFNEVCPMMHFNNQYGIKQFDDFYHIYAYKIAINWSELMHVTIDVYNEEHLKNFVTSLKSMIDKDVLCDTPYMSFCYRQTMNGVENDIIENTALCQRLHLTDKERYALIAHEIGHFVEKKNSRGNGENEEEIACDGYAVELGLGDSLKTALQKIVDAKICTEEKNKRILERIDKLCG